ncbi:hypothetical protein ACVIWV_007609 [Bradyrhizobium diazoefficiens]|uniref:DUF4102 domain-containing protein n=1 Tax=Bradyrhizobium TaxID=374 RepID=UPI001013D3CD|nr:DUF4102 domain-containing protein [Bradyrhizobium diazoefficiens]MBR0866384.1 DUF4102 domain-containing protein [Bradyrhizobium diazoefficiens]MBR0890866.1 DUF4102 domain-containing protein [Bradyrhizobium diazoefficiens]MBR0922632.1 DUF4102 domain-containing protein [Bradyrhizobium diazoefficiens]
MPAKKITEAWVRNLTWAKAINRHGGAETGKKQVTFIDTIDRGLALVLVLSSGGTKAWRVITYANGKAQSRKIGTYPRLVATRSYCRLQFHFQYRRKISNQRLQQV